MPFYLTLMRKSYLNNLQYRAAHMINNLGSMIFGLMFIAIWQGTLGDDRQVIGFGAQEMGQYIAFVQCLIFLNTFLPRGFGMDEGVRTGAISLQLMRPVSFFGYYLAHCLGYQGYNFLFRSIPLFLIFSLMVGVSDGLTWAIAPLLVLSLAMSFYLGFLFNYFVGMAAFWTYDIRWAFIVSFTLIQTLSGFFVPLPIMPGFIGEAAMYLPWAGLNYYPVMIYLGQPSWLGVWVPLVWCVLLTLAALWLTGRARRKMEVQGG